MHEHRHARDRPARRRAAVVEWTAADATRALRGDDRPFVLSGAWAGGSVIAGSEPVRVARPDEDPFALLDDLPEVEGLADAPVGAVGGGWFGTSASRSGTSWSGCRRRRPRGMRCRRSRWRSTTTSCAGTRTAAGGSRRSSPRSRGGDRPPPCATRGPRRPAPDRSARARSRPRRRATAGLRAAVAECVERIAAGELFQANLTLRLEGAFAGDPIDAFAAGRRDAAGPRRVRRRAVGRDGRPLARAVPAPPRRATCVTRADQGHAAARRRPGDAAARAALVASAKDSAENVMIVDLMRNDLGRVCATGTVRVGGAAGCRGAPGRLAPRLRGRGRLRAGVGDGELLRATFPPGSVTGAPKVQALHVIAELEGAARAGVHAARSASRARSRGSSSTSRSARSRSRGGRAWLGAGGGIVADSDPDAEVAEASTRRARSIAALGAELPRRRTRRAVAPRLPRALDGGLPAPDPALGVFETIAVRDGAAGGARGAPRAAAPRRRGACSGSALPGGLRDGVAAAAAGAERRAAAHRRRTGRRGDHRATRRRWRRAREPVALAPVVAARRPRRAQVARPAPARRVDRAPRRDAAARRRGRQRARGCDAPTSGSSRATRSSRRRPTGASSPASRAHGCSPRVPGVRMRWTSRGSRRPTRCCSAPRSAR